MSYFKFIALMALSLIVVACWPSKKEGDKISQEPVLDDT